MNYLRINFFLFFFFTLTIYGQESAPSGLLCELLPHPELSVITATNPGFSWIVNSEEDGDHQLGYQIQVVSSPDSFKNNYLWDSGEVASQQSINVDYEGKELKANQSYFWRVRTWNKKEGKSPWSVIQRFNTSDFNHSYSWPGESRWVEINNSKDDSFWTFEDREPTVFYDQVPEKIVFKKDKIFYDFGKDAFAYLTFNITWNSNDDDKDYLDIALGERAVNDSIDAVPLGGSIIYETYRLKLKSGTNDYILKIPRFIPEYPHSQSLPLQMPEVIPFQYVEITKKNNLKINEITRKALHVIFDNKASSFLSSDDDLNAIYELSKYSTIANTFNGDYANSNRERMMYEADCYIQQLCHYSIDRKFTTARYSMENLIYHASWPTEWIMHSIFMAYADYLYTGNTEMIEKYYGDLKAKTLKELETPVGLISTRTELQTEDFLKSIHYGGEELNDIVDWPNGLQGIYPSGETDHFEYKTYNSVVNAFYYRSLLLMGKMASAINYTEDAAFFQNKAEKVKGIFNKSFFNDETKLYVDGIGSKHSSLHANMFPLAFGLVPNEKKESIVNFVKGKWMACGVYGAFYLMQALYDSEEGEYALNLMTNDSDRGWLNMIRVGATMTTEAWDQKYMPDYYSWNHAWSASPAYIIPHYMIGIQPVEAGFSEMIIKPQPGKLEWAKMKLPTIRGNVVVEIKQKSGDFFNLDLKIPANTTAKVYIPKISEECSLIVDGKEITNQTVDGSWFVINCSSGRHSFRSEKI
ncbi:alpha-L-rhamnosidase C-terminal domain-containing protein [Autumnicola edwardsiae]|uniref:alpha-L-rhamnosidase n=1 Tax=Autumnicola edwardsiae TaxID=3075594 RepID=A0ABU3CXH5_9FLAO|nr:alpha-L-rhamnosidase C-terminal domain-containing protein [Zunongwangia sp. F297]MDT0651060.1 alpha-L-rhamnosidase C-terminal domain-containing protein [Zunongwangia sp. F297]